MNVTRLIYPLLAVALAAGLSSLPAEDAAGAKSTRPVEEWKKLLTPEEFNVLVQHGTERPFTSPLNKEKREGVFVCAADPTQVLFNSADKFESGTGWPSFTRPASANAVTEHSDIAYGMTRVEVRCAKTGLHLGHVFNDGPPPTGKRYCMNGVALKFIPKDGAPPKEEPSPAK